MKNLIIPFRRQRILAYSIVVLILVNLMAGVVAFSVNRSLRQRQELEVSDRYLTFQQDLFDLIDSGSILLKGFEAYLKVEGEDITLDEMNRYLAVLAREDMTLIRNIAVIKDTTIVHNYPLEGNESSIGVDLAQVPAQREVILQTKNEGVRSLTGPVDLVQGGQGYIIRLPIQDKEDAYWGQISIVMYAEAVNSAIAEFADDTALDVVIFKTPEHLDLIYGNASILDMNPLQYPGNPLYNDWSINVIPVGGWDGHRIETLLVLLAGLVISLVAGFAVDYFQKINYNLQFALAHDHLTGLYNRYCLELAQKSLMEKREKQEIQFGIMLIDLDNFKLINDTYGHNIGDEVLVETGRILKKLSRKDEMVFRIGGDEFLILMPGIEDEVQLQEMKRRFEQDFMKAFILDGLDRLSVDIGPSMGVAMYPHNGRTFDQVLIYADRDMYREKSNHKER